MGYLLHALRAELSHPTSGERLRLYAAPPAELCDEGEAPFVEGEGGDVAGGTDGRSDACAAGDGEQGELPPSSPRRTSSPDREADEAPRKQPKTGA